MCNWSREEYIPIIRKTYAKTSTHGCCSRDYKIDMKLWNIKVNLVILAASTANNRWKTQRRQEAKN
jgi:hypothetical protein